MSTHREVFARTELVQGMQESPFADAAREAWGAAAARECSAKELTSSVDAYIKEPTVPKADQEVVKKMAEALAAGDLTDLDKCVKSLSSDPKALERLAKELNDVFLKFGLKTVVTFNSKDKVLEIDDQANNKLHVENRLMIPAEAGKAPMGNHDGVHYDDYKKNSKGELVDTDELAKLQKDADAVAKGIQESLKARCGDRPKKVYIEIPLP